MPEKINKIFSSPDVKHGLSLFTPKEMEAVENMIIEKDGNFYIRSKTNTKSQNLKKS